MPLGGRDGPRAFSRSDKTGSRCSRMVAAIEKICKRRPENFRRFPIHAAFRLVPIHKRHLSVHAGVLALRNPRRSRTTPAVAKSLRPWPEPKSTISGWTPGYHAYCEEVLHWANGPTGPRAQRFFIQYRESSIQHPVSRIASSPTYPLYFRIARSKPGIAFRITASSTQKAMRKWPGPLKPLPGTTSTRSSLSACTNSTSSAIGEHGNR